VVFDEGDEDQEPRPAQEDGVILWGQSVGIRICYLNQLQPHRQSLPVAPLFPSTSVPEKGLAFDLYSR
jgi:hypothetical protein